MQKSGSLRSFSPSDVESARQVIRVTIHHDGDKRGIEITEYELKKSLTLQKNKCNTISLDIRSVNINREKNNFSCAKISRCQI